MKHSDNEKKIFAREKNQTESCPTEFHFLQFTPKQIYNYPGTFSSFIANLKYFTIYLIKWKLSLFNYIFSCCFNLIGFFSVLTTLIINCQLLHGLPNSKDRGGSYALVMVTNFIWSQQRIQKSAKIEFIFSKISIAAFQGPTQM